jgi:D-ribose pyranase
MSAVWEYLRLPEPDDLTELGRAGWELVAIQGAEWVFKRPAPDPAERFTAEQRDAALADVEAHQAVTRGLLHPEVAALIRRVNHTQMLLLADRGFPAPAGPATVDLALSADIPTIPQVLAAILPDLPLDRLIVAAEQQEAAPARFAWHRQSGSRLEVVPHAEFKRLAGYAVGCIRTGDSAPYGNVLVVGG